MNSIERALIAVARGWSAGPSPCSMTRQDAPRQPRSPASARPTGPPPTIRTGVSIVGKLSGIRSRTLFRWLDRELGLGYHVGRRVDRVVDDGRHALPARRLEIELERRRLRHEGFVAHG